MGLPLSNWTYLIPSGRHGDVDKQGPNKDAYRGGGEGGRFTGVWMAEKGQRGRPESQHTTSAGVKWAWKARTEAAQQKTYSHYTH